MRVEYFGFFFDLAITDFFAMPMLLAKTSKGYERRLSNDKIEHRALNALSAR